MFTYFRNNIHEFYNIKWNRKFLLRETLLHEYNYKKGGVNKMLVFKKFCRKNVGTDFPEVKHRRLHYYD